MPTREDLVEYLNRCLAADSAAVHELMSTGTKVNNATHENPIVCERTEDGVLQTSALGLINGFMQFLGHEPVYAITDESDSKILRFNV